MRGLNRHYYSIAISYRKNDFEMKMLVNLNKVAWSNSLQIQNFKEREEENNNQLKKLGTLASDYENWITEEITKTPEELVVSQVGKINPKNHLLREIDESLSQNIVDCLGTMMNTELF